MPLSVTSDKTSYGYLEAATLTVSGGTPATRYIVTVVNPNGHTSRYSLVTDGVGAGTVGLVAQTRGSFAAEVRPAAEHEGKTTPAATLNFKGQ